jgi:hypothetical protein
MALIKPSKHLREPVAILADPNSPNKQPSGSAPNFVSGLRGMDKRFQMGAPASSSVKIQETVPSAKQWLERTTLPPIKKASELMNTPIPMPLEIIKGVLSEGSTMVYGGASKTNKTFALMDLAISVAAGVPWWNIETAQGKVLYLDFELKEYYFQKRLKAICCKKNVSYKALENDFDVWNLRGHGKCIKELSPHILERARNGGYRLIIIDPIYKVLGDRDENSAGDINSLMNELEAISVMTGAAIVVGHHFSKGGQAGKDSMDRISGSGVFARSPDAIVIITKHQEDDVYTVEVTARDFTRVEPFCVEWDYPLMTRNETLDPKKLKQGGAAKTKYVSADLIKALGVQELTTTEWQAQTIKATGMSVRTFMDKRKDVVTRELVTEVNGKWKAISPTHPPGWKSPSAEEVQTATTAIAPAASI